MKADDMREELIKRGLSEEEVATMKIKDLRAQMSATDNFDVQFSEPLASTIEETLPRYGSQEWNDYVIAQFGPDEIQDGSPKYNGLRRVAELLLGEIIESGVKDMNVIPTDRGRVVTVNYEIVINCHAHLNLGSMNIKDTASAFYLKRFCGMADCESDYSTSHGKHPAASAETKAATRALKKALALNTLTFEEKIAGDSDISPAAPTSKISGDFVKSIEQKVKVLNSDPSVNISIPSIIKELGYSGSLGDLNMDQGRAVFAKVNEYQQSL